ncbi:SH3 domain-containing protein [Streptomyces sp. NPDC059913]|uniref:SH3 domain-containing protein n=1 Tax=unclassified Streptomyces TaxID=2593676 RepID=UPI00331E49A2
MRLKTRVTVGTIGTALAMWGMSAPAQASASVADGGYGTQGTIQCAPESQTYTVKTSGPAAVRSGPSKAASQVDVVYPGNKVTSKYHCVNNGWVFICISLCKVDENGVAGRWVFRGDVG